MPNSAHNSLRDRKAIQRQADLLARLLVATQPDHIKRLAEEFLSQVDGRKNYHINALETAHEVSRG